LEAKSSVNNKLLKKIERVTNHASTVMEEQIGKSALYVKLFEQASELVDELSLIDKTKLKIWDA
jgi:hypothetical protein